MKRKRKSKEQIAAEKLSLRFRGYSALVIEWLYVEPDSFEWEDRDIDSWVERPK